MTAAELWRDAGTLDLVETEPGQWEILLTHPLAVDSPPGTFPTEGAALDAAKAWARQRDLITTWATLVLRQKVVKR
jgi:hypothetical protein